MFFLVYRVLVKKWQILLHFLQWFLHYWLLNIFQIPISAIPPFRDGRSAADYSIDPSIKTEPTMNYFAGSGRGFGSPTCKIRSMGTEPRRSISGGKSRVTSQLGGMGKKVVSMSVKHVCSVCSKAFQTQSGLWKHSSVHTGKFSYNCSVCGKGFNEKHMYEGHMNMHEGIGFTCMRCKKTFGLKTQLLAHQKKCTAV